MDSVLHIWKYKPRKEKQNLVNIIDSDNYFQNYHDIYTQEDIIDSFILKNKEKMINNIEKYIQKENFES